MSDKDVILDPIDSNLQDILQYCKVKEQLVLARKFWLWNYTVSPLQQIGKDYGLTRERIRQIENQALMRMRRLMVWNPKYMELIVEAKKILQENNGIMTEDMLLSRLLQSEKFVFTKQEMRIILTSDFDVSHIKRNKWLLKSFYIEPLFEDLLNSLTTYISTYFVDQQEWVDMYEFIDHLQRKYTAMYDNIVFLRSSQFYITFFSLLKNIKIFDGRIGVDSFADVNPKTIKLKIIYVLEKEWVPIHFQKMAEKLTEWFPHRNIKISTVHNELVKNNKDFVNLGLWIYWLRSWGFLWWTVAEITARILKSSWRFMTIKEIARDLLKEKMVAPNTIMINLQRFDTVFERKEKWLYGLKKELYDLSLDEISAMLKKN